LKNIFKDIISKKECFFSFFVFLFIFYKSFFEKNEDIIFFFFKNLFIFSFFSGKSL